MGGERVLCQTIQPNEDVFELHIHSMDMISSNPICPTRHDNHVVFFVPSKQKVVRERGDACPIVAFESRAILGR